MELKGEFTALRPLTTDDAQITLKWRLSERARLLNRGAQTIEQQKSWIIASEQSGDLNFMIEYQESPVGMIALHDISTTHRNAIIGRLLIGEQSVVGNAPVSFEAEVLLLDYAFKKLGLHKIYGDIREDNTGVIKLRSYLGYHQDGILRDYIYDNGQYINGIMVSILENEYWEICRPKLIGMINLLSKYSLK
jgi:RimJ/RimL family protein N-acetyltransferase